MSGIERKSGRTKGHLYMSPEFRSQRWKVPKDLITMKIHPPGLNQSQSFSILRLNYDLCEITIFKDKAQGNLALSISQWTKIARIVHLSQWEVHGRRARKCGPNCIHFNWMLLWAFRQDNIYICSSEHVQTAITSDQFSAVLPIEGIIAQW